MQCATSAGKAELRANCFMGKPALQRVGAPQAPSFTCQCSCARTRWSQLRPHWRPHRHRPPVQPRQTICARAASGSLGSSGSSDAGGGSCLAAAVAAVSSFVQDQYLPLALSTALCIGCLAPQLGVAAAGFNVAAIVTTGIFILQGLSLKRGEAVKALRSSGCVAYGLTAVLLITPLMGWLVAKVPLQPPELAIGLAVFCCMPTALSSGVTFTQQVGGNVALALLLTVSSNTLGIFTLPFLLSLALGSEAGGVHLSPWPLLLQLVQTILVPMMVGASIRAFVPGVRQLVDNNKKALSYANSTLLALVPWIQVSKAVAQKAPLEPASVAASAVLGILIHMSFLSLNIGACRLLNLGGPDPVAARQLQQALILTASVKTLPVAVTVIGKLGPLLGEMAGVAVVPCVLAHLGQIIVDAFLVTRWQKEQLQEKQALA